MRDDASASADRPDAAPSSHKEDRDWSWVPLVLGLASASWAVAILLPTMRDLPAWPAASAGVFALVLARMPGRALPRGIGAFLGLLGLLIGLLEIAALWGVLELLG